MKSLHSGIWLPFMHLADWDCVIIASQWETAATQLHPWYDWVMHEGKLERICQKNKKDGKRHESERCMTNKDIIDMERRREKPDLFSIFLNRSISPFVYWAAGYISHVTHMHRERKEHKGSPVVSRKTLKEILNITQAHTSHTQQEVRHTLLQSTQVSLPVDRVAASHVTPQCQFMLFIAQAWSKNRPNKVKKEKSAGPGVVTIVLAEKPDQKLGGFNSYPHMPLVPVPWWPIKTHFYALCSAHKRTSERNNRGQDGE